MDLTRIVRTHITTGESNPPAESISSLDNGALPLTDVVRALGEYSTSTEDETRLKGLTFLGNVIKTINPTRINRPATQTLTNFFSAKSDDFDSLAPASQALTVSSKLSTFGDDAAVEVYKGIVEQVNLKAYVQATRHLAYVLIDSLLASHRKASKDLGAEFLNSYTKLVDGEKDPRNSMLVFSMDRVILLEFEVADHIEDLFDITFCYFPIMFKPPPNDPYGITAEDLKIALRGCMAATPLFSKMAIPLFLEKFSTATGPAMKDLSQSMTACFPVYGAEAVRERGTELWEGIKTEIMYSSDASIEAAALACLESLIKTSYPTSGDSPAGLAQDVIKESLALLDEPEKSQATSGVKVIACLSRASPNVGAFAYSQALPQLFRQFNNPALPSHRAPILSAISSLVFAARSVYGSSETTRSQSDEKTLEPFRDNIIDVLREGLRTDDSKSPAIKGTVPLVELPGFIDPIDVEHIVRGLNDILVNDKTAEHRSAVVKASTAISVVHPALVENITLPLLFHNLPETAPGIDEVEARDQYRDVLKSLSELCVQPALFETSVVRVTTKLDLMSSSPSISSENDSAEYRECEVAFIWDSLNALLGVIETKIKHNHLDVVKHFDRIIIRLNTLAFNAAGPSTQPTEPLFRDGRLSTIVGRSTETMVWELSLERQAKYFAAVYNAFERGSVGQVVHDVSSVTVVRSPMKSGASLSEKNLVVLYSSAVQGMKAGVTDPFPSAEAFSSDKITWAVNEAANEYQLNSMLELICAYVNKREQAFKQTLEGISETVWVREVIDTEQAFETRRRGLSAYLYILKALTLSRQPLAYTAVDRVIGILKSSGVDPSFVNEAARGFSVIAQGKGKDKGKASHLTGKLLYAQKMWNHVLPQSLEGDGEATGRERLPYLIAFASSSPLVPASLCSSDSKTILPLLLRSLALRDPTQRVNAIITLISILETQNLTAEVDTLLHSHASNLVEGLIKSALPSDGMQTNPHARATASRALALIPDAIRLDTSRPAKSGIIRDLGKALDDPVRSVRREAVECRARWYRYGQ